MPGTLESLSWDLKLEQRARLHVVLFVLEPLDSLFVLAEDKNLLMLEEEDLRLVTLL